ncbi:MAG: hypothetical protein ACOCV2_04090 [Persicimonas sp.]
MFQSQDNLTNDDDRDEPLDLKWWERWRLQFYPGKQRPLEVDENYANIAVQHGPARTRLKYVVWVVLEALSYACVLAFFIIMAGIFGDGSSSTSVSLYDRVVFSFGTAGVVGGVFFVMAIPTLLVIRRRQLDWHRLTVDEEGVDLTHGYWFGRRSGAHIEPEDIARLNPRITLTHHLDVAEEREVIDLTLDSKKHFETFAEALEPGRAHYVARSVNQVLSRKGSAAAADPEAATVHVAEDDDAAVDTGDDERVGAGAREGDAAKEDATSTKLFGPS